MKYVIILLAVIALIFILRTMKSGGPSSESKPDKIPYDGPKPVLKQFGDLVPEDFDIHPVWVQCHTIDYDEPWYDETDEETFRPWEGKLPVDPMEGMFLVRANLTLADGSKLSGFLTPQHPDENEGKAHLGTIQPQLFLASGERVAFWFGIIKPSDTEIQGLYSALGKSAEQVFPINCETQSDLANGIIAVSVPGFCSSGKRNKIEIRK